MREWDELGPLQRGPLVREREESTKLPRAPQARGVGRTAEHEHLLAGHDIDRQHFEPVLDILLVDADLG